MSSLAAPEAVAREGLRASRLRRRARTTAVTLALLLVAATLAVVALMLGDFRLSAAQVVGALAGSDEEPARFVVFDLRLPRLTLGILVGVAFGLAGALFQSVLRNPLASPDVIGVSQGASAGAVAALLLGGVTGLWVSVAAFAGGAAVGLLLYAVAWRGGLTGHRFVLSGIGVAYVCTSVVGYLLTRSEVREAQAALLWMTGSLAQADWDLVATLALAVAVLAPLVALAARGLDLLLLGDEQAAALGLRPELARGAVIALGVALACAATAAAGPVAFVALVAAPVARRLLGDGSLALVQSALVGVVLVVGADVAAQHLLPAVLPIDLSVPVGVVTGAVGGPYLIWLMVAGRTRSS
ncbi:iron chelate uptake ABC transporter family permease subunit [Nocardioides sp. cx-173]|uniref:FecCD family ABC transporter permease n=1 Tax=Nocardioides sp. cx-173 TaxID=2898796 RepID=UPI001E45A0E5|nr:iron ABC transporter permease [Nocardioides sp. cx-173]MCD4524698.1 iron ABC transporter permease [Nocardioides sp. cx-173]UGB43208.1 iron ABC transporter permease [Nocardioides sp. cx-173]